MKAGEASVEYKCSKNEHQSLSCGAWPEGGRLIVMAHSYKERRSTGVSFNDPVEALAFMRALEGAFDAAWPEYAPLKHAAPEELARAWPNA